MPPRAILFLSLLVNGALGWLLLTWNALASRKWFFALLSLALLFGLASHVRALPHPWWLWHVSLGLILARVADWQFGAAYEGQLFDGRRPMRWALPVGVLASLQLCLLLLIPHPRPVTTSELAHGAAPSPTVSPIPGAPGLSGQVVVGTHRLRYVGCPSDFARRALTQLENCGLFREGKQADGLLTNTPPLLRVAMMVAPGQDLQSGQGAFFQAKAGELGAALTAPGQGFSLDLYEGSTRRWLHSYTR